VIWRVANRAHPVAVGIADRHYNRQKPGTPQFVPPGSCLVLLSTDNLSVWVSSRPFAEYVKHAWAGAWMNTTFRREGGPLLASEMILEALAVTRGQWGDPPPLGMVTFVDASKVRHKRDPGRCYIKAGFRRVGRTKGGLDALQLLPGEWPGAATAINETEALFVL